MCSDPTAECDERTNQQRNGRRPCHAWKDRAFLVRPTSVAELRAGSPRRPHRGTLAAATDEASEGARCGRRDVMQLLFMRQRMARASARARSWAARRVSSPAPRAVRLSLIEWPVTCGQSYAKASDNDGHRQGNNKNNKADCGPIGQQC